MTTNTVPSICRSCIAFCPILVTVEDGRAVKVTGDPEAADYEGYTCPKGRALPEQTNDPERLLHSMKRQADGSYAPITSGLAVTEIAQQVRAIVDQHGPSAVAIYFGAAITQHPFGMLMAVSLLQAIGSPMVFSASTIDKPGEKIAMAMHGYWMAGGRNFEEADTWLIVGANPIIAKSSGLPYNNPGMRLKQAQERGLKLIVIDPRRSDTARRAHVHLQARPGEDPTLLAGIIHIIIRERLHDAEFIAANVRGFDELSAAVAPYTPAYVAQRAGVQEADLLEAARTFARGRRSMAICSTGPSFSMHSNLSFYLANCLNSLCGSWPREGERAIYPNVLLPAFTPKAQPLPAFSVHGAHKMRVMGLRESPAGIPAAALADEILLEGEGQVRALFCIGGNPASAMPDQRKMERALKSLNLLVCLDVIFSATARHAHYVVAPPVPLELPALTYFPEWMKYYGATRGLQNAWAQYTPAAVSPPPGSDVIDEHAFFFRLAQELGLSLTWFNKHGMGQFNESPLQTFPLDMRRVPTLDEMYELATGKSRVPLAEVKKHPHGKRYFEELDIRVAPRDADCTARLEIGDAMMMTELAQVHAQDYVAQRQEDQFPYQLVCRRTNNMMNSIGTVLPGLLKGKAYNPLFIHPADAARVGVADGGVVNIRSRYDTILGVVEFDDSLREGVVSMTHGYGALGEAAERNPFIAGSNVNLIMHTDEHDPISGIPRMSALPVTISVAQGSWQQP